MPMCPWCKKWVQPEDWRKHQGAHRVAPTPTRAPGEKGR